MKWQMKWKPILFCISVVIIILLINAITVQPKKDSTEPHEQARAQPGETRRAQPKAEMESKSVDRMDTPEMNQLTCPGPVKATVGGNVTLDFHFESQQDVTSKLIEWIFNNSIRVLVYRSGGVDKDQTADQFKSRASLESTENISKGKLAVKISSLTKKDAGTYSCIVGRIKSCSVELIILQPKADMESKSVDTLPEMDQLTCPGPVKATVGGNVTLDFHFESQRNVTSKLIEWNFNNSIRVLVYRSGGVDKDQTADQFKSRASLESTENISKGKLAVKISSLTKKDAGTYSCIVGRIKSCIVELIISDQNVIIQHIISTPKLGSEEHSKQVIFNIVKAVIAAVCLVGAFLLFKKWISN